MVEEPKKKSGGGFLGCCGGPDDDTSRGARRVEIPRAEKRVYLDSI